jgi:DNA-directed RNA polymerase specialized sigma24 family protein
VHSQPSCRCQLCRIETQLHAELASSAAAYDVLRVSTSNGLGRFPSPFHLLSQLRAAPAGPSSDDLFRDLLTARAGAPQLVEMLMIVAFVPLLHGTVRRIAERQSHLSRAEITQQALSVFLQVLHSEQMQTRKSHFAFAISRAMKRQLFAWASREGSVHGRAEEEVQDVAQLTDNDTMERRALLRHFLQQCVLRGHLSDAELDLLIRVKLDGNTGDDIAGLNAITSNAVRQRMKRLLAKLRRLARKKMPPQSVAAPHP